MSDQYCLRWNNHQSNMISIFHALLKKEAFTDVTLAVENHTIKCHKLILAACSPYLQKLLEESPCKHPTIILKDIKYTDLKIILDFMYNGEVNIIQEQLASMLRTAQALKVKGLVDMNGIEEREPQLRDVSPPPAISTSTRDIIMAPSSSRSSSPPHSTYTDMYKPDFPRLSTPWHTLLPADYSAATCQPSSLHHHVSTPSLGGNSYDNENLHRMDLDTPILRTALGQGHVGSSQTFLPSSATPTLFRAPRFNGPMNTTCRSIDLTSRRETSLSPPTNMDEEEKKSQRHKETKSDLPKPEWKRYKQYSRAEIDAAITAVKEGMSAVQAARKYNVPSRTLYDKVKKLGITRVKRSTSNTGSSSTSTFYDADDNMNGSVYNAANNNTLSEIENDSVALKKIRQDQDALDSSASCVTSPVIRYANQIQQLSIQEENQRVVKEEYEVEDLSMSSRKYDVSKPSVSDKVKEEMQDAEPLSESDEN